MTPIRLAVVCDDPEEGWPSMDLLGAMIFDRLAAEHAENVAPTRIVPTFRHRMTRVPVAARRPNAARNIDRLVNRMWDYPRFLARVARDDRFDLYHVVDHSYSQLVHVLPPGRAVVTCHDLDTFGCLLRPEHDPRPAWFRAMTRRILAGFCKAAAVVCDSQATRDAVQAHGLIAEDRLHVALLGTHPECSPTADPLADAEAVQWLGPVGTHLDLLHVGTTIPRKRIDVLLDVFAAVHRVRPAVRLIKAGGRLTPDQERRAHALGIAGAIVTVPFVRPAVLAAIYRRASLVLQPSEAEGFGLPAAEALACGAILLASDLPVLREVAGDAAVFRPVGDVPAWVDAALTLLDASPDSTRACRDAGLARARLFSWSAHAQRLADIYRAVLSRSTPPPH